MLIIIVCGNEPVAAAGVQPAEDVVRQGWQPWHTRLNISKPFSNQQVWNMLHCLFIELSLHLKHR